MRPSLDNLDSFINGLVAGFKEAPESGVCARCSTKVGGELTKISDIKTKILAATKLSAKKHFERLVHGKIEQDSIDTTFKTEISSGFMEKKELETTKQHKERIEMQSTSNM